MMKPAVPPADWHRGTASPFDAASGSETISLRRFLQNEAVGMGAGSWAHLALMHRSYARENALAHDNERLEFLGDAVLTTAVSAWLVARYPELPEGTLTKMRSVVINRQTLGQIGVSLGLGGLIHLGRGEATSGGAQRSSVVGSALEALLGAVFLERGYDAARRFVETLVLSDEVVLAGASESGAPVLDAKNKLQEWTQREWQLVPEYVVEAAEGPPHDRRFVVAATLNGHVLDRAEGKRIKDAERIASMRALTKLMQGEWKPPAA